MRRTDIPAVSAISDTVHGAYTEAAAIYLERLERYPAGCFVLEPQGAVAGYLISHPWHRDQPPPLGQPLGSIPAAADTYYLHDIALLPETQGSGAGKAAIALVMARASALGFGDVTLTAVHGADSFWAARGFAYVEAQSAAYGPGSHLMRLAIDAWPHQAI